MMTIVDIAMGTLLVAAVGGFVLSMAWAKREIDKAEDE